MAIIRGVRGEIIDTDLLKIKAQLTNTKRPQQVIERKILIDEKDGNRPDKQDVEELAEINNSAVDDKIQPCVEIKLSKGKK